MYRLNKIEKRERKKGKTRPFLKEREIYQR